MKITVGVIIVLLIMTGCLIGIIVCGRKQKTNPNASMIAIVLMFALVISCIIFMRTQDFFGSGGEAKMLIQNENTYASASAVILGKYLADKFADAKVLVIAGVNYEKNPRQQLLLDSLKQGFGNKITDVVVESFTFVPPSETAPEMLNGDMIDVRPADIDTLIEKYPDRKLVVCFVMPRNVEDMKIWGMDDSTRPKLALLNCEIYNMKAAIASGVVPVAVANSPSAVFSEKRAPSDPQKAFDERFLLVTTENVAEISEKYPKLFE